ncbi:OmpH family outer membrane protein [Tabrizicola sp.]|uniref:OmpH family outer membrane protein n=1 Tax=Tabrizicola sp. TaxID=2005166 RepID=UPI00286CE6B0|nr:OmpH family outer membrane protein [Tabrizicola sp.]
MSRSARLAGLVVALCLWVAAPVAAQDATKNSVVLTLDQDRFFAGSVFGKAALQREQTAVDALAAENLKIEQALEAEEKDLTTKRAALPAAEFAALATAFDTKVENIRAAQDAKSRDIGRKRDEDRQRFFQAAVPALGALLTEMGAVAILDKGAIILSLSVIDVTDAAIARVDASLGDGSAPPAPPPKPAPDPGTPEPAPSEPIPSEP